MKLFGQNIERQAVIGAVLGFAVGCGFGCSRDSSEPMITKDRSDRPSREEPPPGPSAKTEDSASRNSCKGHKKYKLMLEEEDDYFEPGHVDLPHPCPDGMRVICVRFESKDEKRSRYGTVCASGLNHICEWHKEWDCYDD
jgi:hypothetical protein